MILQLVQARRKKKIASEQRVQGGKESETLKKVLEIPVVLLREVCFVGLTESGLPAG